MDSISGVQLAVVAAGGNLQQVYPTWAPTGVNPATATQGQLIRHPQAANLGNVEVETDGTNGGILELWDVNGEEAGADVSSATTITNAQLLALVALGRAKLIYRKDFSATEGLKSEPAWGYRVLHGLAARYTGGGVGAVCYLNITSEGALHYLTNSAGV